VASRNLSPLYASLGVPVMHAAQVREAGELRFGWQLYWASHAVRETGGILEFDGETRRHDLRLTWSFAPRWTLNATVPWIDHSGGRLDALIDGWHDVWGLPDGPRAVQPRDRLRFAWANPPGFLLEAPRSGWGDAELDLAWHVYERDGRGVTLFTHGKLATGRVADFTGTGAGALGAGLRARADECATARLSCHVQLGLIDVGPSPFTQQADERVAFAGLSLAWRVSERLAATAQVEVQDGVYREEPLDASGTPVWGALGLRWRVAPLWIAEVQVGEDPFIDPIPGREHIIAVQRRADEQAPIFAEAWHTDWSFQARPPIGTCLYGIDIPPSGGDTHFANQHAALEAMGPGLRERIEDCLAVHSARLGYAPAGLYGDDDAAGDRSMTIRPSAEAEATQLHRLIRPHSETGRPGVYGCLGYIIGIDGLGDEAALELLLELHAWQTRDEFLYVHEWAPGTLVMWDNRCLLHRATGGYEGHARLLHRTTIGDPAGTGGRHPAASLDRA